MRKPIIELEEQAGVWATPKPTPTRGTTQVVIGTLFRLAPFTLFVVAVVREDLRVPIGWTVVVWWTVYLLWLAVLWVRDELGRWR